MAPKSFNSDDDFLRLDLRTPKIPETKSDGPRWLVWLLRFLAYAIPLGFLLYVLYWNFLPFGYNKTFTIDVGSPGDTSGEFYLEPSRDLSERKTAPDGSTYRELNGIAYAVFKPKAVLKNATITVSVEGLPRQSEATAGVSIIPPVIDFNPDSVEWDYAWDFTKATSDNGLITFDGNASSSPALTGNAFPFDGCMYFDGKSRLEMASSSDMFESGPFTVYVEWKPENSTDNFQEIVGHYNWELLQNKDSVQFQIGRMNDAQGHFYSVSYPITPDFFNQKHSALAIYTPGATSTDNGYIDLFVDGNNARRTSIGTSTIFADYNGDRNLTFGNKFYQNNFFKGCLFRVSFNYKAILSSTKDSFTFSGTVLRIALETSTTTTLAPIKINATQH
jgi:hypothetical protein